VRIAQRGLLVPDDERPQLLVKGKLQPYKVVCISLYVADIDRSNAIVSELKRDGYTKANRSWVIREALKQFDKTKLPGPYVF
jgi:hypothetical protein